MKRKAFTLVELMIVVSILGILGAIVLPMFQNQTLLAKESAAQDTLRSLRSQCELYKLDHNGLGPGYNYTPMGTLTNTVAAKIVEQFTCTTDIKGVSSTTTTKTAVFTCGPYFMKMPVNPFNDKRDIKLVADFATEADKSTGWLFKRDTCEFKLNWTGTDSKGANYLDY
ncbi:MAG: type II secretion system protein [Anaerohalosphaeraceae bacterium]